MTKSNLKFFIVLPGQIWLAHALCFFAHEFAHSISAWALGWKESPFALHYPPVTVPVLLAQFGINENVDYWPVFAGGHGEQAAFIAAAGMVIGNMFFTYTLGRWAFRMARRVDSRYWGMFFYLVTVASIGNLWDYVPIRTFATDGDMRTIEQGLGCSPWWILFVPGLATLAILVHFFRKMQPETLTWLFPGLKFRRAVLIVLSCLGLFAFYGAAGWVEDSGPESKYLSMLSVFVLFPAMTLFSFRTMRKTKSAKEIQKGPA